MANLLEQEKVYRLIVGERIIQLAEAVFQNRSRPTPVFFRAWNGHGLLSVSAWVGDENIVCRTFNSTESELTKWHIQPATDVSLDQLDVNKDYPFHVVEDDPVEDGKSFLCCSASQPKVVVGDNKSLSLWYIKPVAPGTETFTLQYKGVHRSRNYDGMYVVSKQTNRIATWNLREHLFSSVRGTYEKFTGRFGHPGEDCCLGIGKVYDPVDDIFLISVQSRQR